LYSLRHIPPLLLRSRSLLVLFAIACCYAAAILFLPQSVDGKQLLFQSDGSLFALSQFPDSTIADSTSFNLFDSIAVGEQFPPDKEFTGPPKGGRGRDQSEPIPDSVLFPKDTSVAVVDTNYVVFLDSTARMAHFENKRKDHPSVDLFPRRQYALRARRSAGNLRREVSLDSSGILVTFRETIGGEDTRVPLQMTLSEYIRARRQYELRRLLADEATKPLVVVKRDDLGELLSNITQIQIPIPSNPIFSIFGKPEIRLNISGAVDIKAGFRTTQSDQTQLASADQTRSEPDFSQEVQVNVNGNIGDKLNILADWNTQRTFEYENQLKIKYTGYDDEIVQSVEAGNVALTTPSSFVGSSQALFGAKALFQTGPLRLTAVASQKKGQIKEVAVSGGAQRTIFEKRAWEYATNHFFVDTSYIQYYEPYYQNDPPTVNGSVQIVEEEVWVTKQGNQYDPNDRPGIAYIDLPGFGPGGYDSTLRNQDEIPGIIEKGKFVKLQRSQYELSGDGYIGVLSLNTNVQDQQIVAIAYRTSGGQQFGELSRDYGTDTARTVVLKLVKPKNLNSIGPRYSVAWRMLLKNIYALGSRNLKQEGFRLDVFRIEPEAEPIASINGERALRVFGLDRYNADGTASQTGDNLFDFRPRITVNMSRSEIVFPTLYPFKNGITRYFEVIGSPLDTANAEKFLYPEVYDTTKTVAQQRPLHDRYLIKGEATGDATSKYSLGFNVVEGSVQVLLDGRQMVQNVDFTVDYIVGEVIIRNEQALVPGANLQIKYEQNDLFQLASKTLLGARGDIALGKQTSFGFTVMNLNQKTLSDKVRLGEEPNNNTIFGVDGATSFDLPFLTRGIDALPLLSTRDLSSMRIAGEMAYMLPDPNTQKSTIPSDGGEGIAYIDDFEGARRTIPFGVNFSQWTLSSPPDSIGPFTAHDTTKVLSKGKLVWYNNLNQTTRLTEVYPNKRPGNAANDRITVLDLQYLPLERGPFNYSSNLPGTLNYGRNWGGIMKPISISAVNIINENVGFIEIWMKMDSLTQSFPQHALVIDMGAVSEDVIPNRTLNDEDLVLSNNANGTLQEGEDVGLDMLSNAQELALYPGLAPDPSGDDYSFQNTSTDYSKINGTENNQNGPAGRIPDTEDLNGNGIVDVSNSFFQYVVPLDANPQTNPLIVGGGNEGWFQYRIPLLSFTKQVGSPTFENVEYVRFSIINAQSDIRIRIADMGLIGNQWQERRKGDSTFAVNVISVEDNPFYTSPPGVFRERDKTRPDEEVLANEQSLALIISNMPDGEARDAVKFYTFKPLDVFNYSTMKMFVHGDTTFAYNGPGNYDAEYYFQFGADTSNYYEFRAPLRPGWDPLNEMVVRFGDLTGIKQGRDSTNRVDSIAVPGGPPGSYYLVRGNPSLIQIRTLSVGVRNPPGVGTSLPISGQAWVNELRLTSVDDSPGLAYRVDTQLKLADLGTVSFNYAQIDPNFHTLEQRFGTRQTGTNWSFNTSLSLDKFFPTDWVGTTVPVSYSHTETKTEPKYLPGSDILVSEAAERSRGRILAGGGSESDAAAAANRVRYESETERISDTYAAPNFRIGLPSNAWYVRDTWNKLNFGFNYTQSKDHSPAVVYSSNWSWTARVGYALTLSPNYNVTPFKELFDGVWFLDEYKNMKFFFPISSFSWSINGTRSKGTSLLRAPGAREALNRNFTASRQIGFSWRIVENGPLNVAGDYNVSVESSLLKMETDAYGNQRPFSAIISDIFGGGDRFLNFGDNTRFAQRNTFTTKPNIPNIFNIKKFVDFSFGYGVDYAWNNSLTAGDLGKSAGFSNNINVSMNFRMKSLFDPLFSDSPSSTPVSTPPPRGRRGALGAVDTSSVRDTSRTTSSGGNPLGQLKKIAEVLIKIPFLDYDNLNITFTQNNAAQNNGVIGGTGFANFWSIPFAQGNDPNKGPSRLYQLGLISDPTGKLVNFGTRSSFPFFGWDVEQGIRAPGPGGTLINQFRQANRVGLKTSRGLWEGARADLNWNLGWTYARTQNLTTDSIGIATINNSISMYSIERSFLTFPDVLFFGVFKTGIKEVGKRYAELKASADSTTDAEKLTQAFEQGFEAIPIFKTLFGQYYPRINWSLRWDGLEKIPLFASFVTRLSLDHSYQSTYARQYRNLPGSGEEVTDGQRVSYGFNPLIGLNFTFKDLFKGSMGATVRFNSTTSFDLQTSSRNIVETLSQEISITMSYNRRGFEIPLFGVALNNDVDVSATYSLTKNQRRQYEVARIDVNAEGSPLDGTTRTVLEPRIRYILSSRVTASIYYRYTKIAPDETGSLIPGSTINEAGLDVHISIQ